MGRAPRELGGGGGDGAAVAPFLSRGAAVAGRGGAGRLGKHVLVLILGGGGPEGVLGVEAVGGGAMDATASSLAQEKTRLGSGERGRSGEGVEHVCCTGQRGGNGRGRRRGAVGRRCTTSSWRLGDYPRRARSGLRRVAKSRCFRKAPVVRRGLGRGEGAARGRRSRRPAQTGEGERGKERVERDLIDSKFKIFSKLPFET